MAKSNKASKDEGTPPVRDLSQFLGGTTVKGIRQKFGANIFQRASDMDSGPIRRIPTKIFAYDYALGGGFAVGRVNVVWGHKSSAKTTIFLKTIAQAQQMCANCWQYTPCNCEKGYRDPIIAYLDVEGTLDFPWAKKLGVDLERLAYSKCEFAEQALDIADLTVRNGVDILVLDSIAFLTPAKEIINSTSDETPAMQARLTGKGIRKFVSAINTVCNERGFGPTLLFTNQVRSKVGVIFGTPDVQPGGQASGFASTLEVKHRAGNFDMDKESGVPLTAEFHFRVEKNKSSRPRMEGDFKMVLTESETRKVGDVLNEGAMVDRAERLGLVTGQGSSWEAMGQKFRGRSAIERALVTDPELYNRLYSILMSTL